MKLIMESWRQFLKEEEQDTQGFMEFENIGQLKAALSAARSARNIRDLGKSGTATIAGAADLSSFGILPALKYIWKKTLKEPGLAKSNPALNKLMIDPEVSKVVDDDIELKFLEFLASEIEGKADDEKIEDMDMTRMLAKYIKQDYDGTIVSPRKIDS